MSNYRNSYFQKVLTFFPIIILLLSCDIIDEILGSENKNNSTNNGDSETDLTELIDSTNWIDIDIRYTYYDIVDDPETYDGDDGEIDVECYKLIHMMIVNFPVIMIQVLSTSQEKKQCIKYSLRVNLMILRIR
ncbi:MAG: hypothetical protein GWP19_03160 [Planctomycetia bacterium]|nr:hypothetical protein [Planctomycetia bacterium]